MLPGVEIVTSSVPLIALFPDHVPDAEQLVALVEDQVNVITLSRRTDDDDALRVEVGLGSGGVGDPPPPPPPQETINNKTSKVEREKLLLSLKILLQIKKITNNSYKHNMFIFKTII